MGTERKINLSKMRIYFEDSGQWHYIWDGEPEVIIEPSLPVFELPFTISKEPPPQQNNQAESCALTLEEILGVV